VRELLFERPQDIESLVRAHVIADEALLGAVEQAVSSAPHLDEPQRDDLRRGVAALRNGDCYACRHLLPGVEGALWLSAEGEAVIDSQRRMLHTGKPSPPPALNVSWLLRERGGIRVGQDFAWFLLNAVFDDVGQDIRHGRARSGHETSSVWSFVALLGWLDRFAETNLCRSSLTGCRLPTRQRRPPPRR
jgi:hypothetical protein